MRILHLNHHGTNVGGVEGYIADVARALDGSGHASRLIHFADDRGDLIADTTFVPAVQGEAHKGSLPAELENAIAEFQPDLVYVHAIHQPYILKGIAQRLPTVGYVHSPHVVCPGYAQYLRRTSRVCPHRASLVCLTCAQIEGCCFGRSPLRHAKRLTEVRSFIRMYQNIPSLVGSTFMRQLLRRNRISFEQTSILPPMLLDNPLPELVPASRPRQILFVGRLTPEKGLRQLIEAVAPLEAEWELLVAGDGEERGVCQDLTTRLGVAGKVRFEGWLDQPELHRLYQESAFVVVPSLWPEPFGRVGPEAFQHGRPVVAFAVGGAVDWLEDGVTGHLVPPGDVTELGSCIQALLESPSRQRKMGTNAHAYASKSWSAEAHIDCLLHHFRHAIEHARVDAPADKRAGRGR